MQFTQIIFLIGFLPVSYYLYKTLSRRKVSNKTLNMVLLGISLLFYAFGSLKSLFVLVFLLLWNWVGASAIVQADTPQKKRQSLWLCVGIDLLVLFLYRYFNAWMAGFFGLFGQHPTLPEFIMPIGLSFYLFSSLSYVFDVYYGKAEPCSLLDFGLFAAFFGRVNMGPIGHYAKFRHQLDHHPISRKLANRGTALFLQGLFFKVLLADNFGLLFQALFGNASWLGNLMLGFAYFFELYFDFAGYSRMARGLGCLFGFEIPRNFNRPYQALSVQDFWRRWHISLTDWFRDYVYIPLGGNRVNQKRWIFNILVVWALTGIWHGTTWCFVLWGLYEGGLILLEKFRLNAILEKWPKPLRHAYLILAQLLGWTLFSSASLMEALSRLGRYAGIGISGLADSASLFYLYGSLVLFAVAVFICTPYPARIKEWINERLHVNRGVIGAIGYGFCFLLSLAFLIAQSSQTFLYAGF